MRSISTILGFLGVGTALANVKEVVEDAVCNSSLNSTLLDTLGTYLASANNYTGGCIPHAANTIASTAYEHSYASSVIGAAFVFGASYVAYQKCTSPAEKKVLEVKVSEKQVIEEIKETKTTLKNT